MRMSRVSLRVLRPGQAGFTLLELIVAVSILALVAVFSWRGLDAIVRTRDSLNLAQARLDGLSRCFNRIERDAMNAQTAVLAPGGRFRLLAGGSAAVEYALEGEALTRRVLGNGADLPGAERAVSLTDGVQAVKVEVFRRASAGTSTRGPVPPPGAATSAAGALGNSPDTTGSWTPLANEALAPEGQSESPASPASAAATAGPFGPLTLVGPLQPSAPTGVRVTLSLKSGGDVQRIFLLGAGA